MTSSWPEHAAYAAGFRADALSQVAGGGGPREASGRVGGTGPRQAARMPDGGRDARGRPCRARRQGAGPGPSLGRGPTVGGGGGAGAEGGSRWARGGGPRRGGGGWGGAQPWAGRRGRGQPW